MERHWTATVLVLEGDKTLFIYHKKFSKWAPPGGHVEKNELLHEAALREVKEEVGLDVELITDEHLHVDEPNAESVPRPFLIQLEQIPDDRETPAHEHIDAIFIGKVVGDLTPKGEETAKWLTLDEVEKLAEEGLVFKETKDALFAAYHRERAYV